MPSGSIFESLGDPFGDPGLPRDLQERQGGKSDRICGSGVLPGTPQGPFCLDRTLCFEIRVFVVFLLDGRSVETELHFLVKMLVRGSTPGPPKDTPNR